MQKNLKVSLYEYNHQSWITAQEMLFHLFLSKMLKIAAKTRAITEGWNYPINKLVMLKNKCGKGTFIKPFILDYCLNTFNAVPPWLHLFWYSIIPDWWRLGKFLYERVTDVEQVEWHRLFDKTIPDKNKTVPDKNQAVYPTMLDFPSFKITKFVKRKQNIGYVLVC